MDFNDLPDEVKLPIMAALGGGTIACLSVAGQIIHFMADRGVMTERGSVADSQLCARAEVSVVHIAAMADL